MGLCTSQTAKNSSSPQKKFAMQNIRQFYRFGKVLGQGSYGTVRVAYNILEENDGQQSKAFAVKTINKETLGNQFPSIQRELDILTQLDHPNIIRVFETFEDERHYHFVMEYCCGGQLLDRIKTKGTLTEDQAAYMMSKLFSALEYVHEQGIVHRDMKPENLLLTSEDSFDIKIIDFGLSKKINDKNVKTKEGLVGTPLYAAPEAQEGKLCLESDNWSLGCIMYVLLCGSTPFYSDDKDMLAAMIRHSAVEFEQKSWTNITQDAKTLIEGLLTKDPKKRTGCLKALKGSWIAKHAHNGSKRYMTKQLSLSIRDVGSTMKLLVSYADTSQFKKVALKLMLNHLKESETIDLRIRFEILNKNGNGVISAAELKQDMNQMGPTGPVKEIDRVLNKLNQDNNDKLYIKYSEYLAASLNTKSQLNKQRLMSLYKQFDLTGKGFIDVNDLKSTIQREGRSLQNQKLSEIFQEIDLTNKGTIDFDEFQHMMLTSLITDDIGNDVDIQQTPLKNGHSPQQKIIELDVK